MIPSLPIGVVVIGRNEGERLQRCLQSLRSDRSSIVYVDSGSTDGSVEYAKSIGVEVVELDMSRPFTMARGRNAGFQRLMQVCPDAVYVQFVDGDCEVADGWIATAESVLNSETNVVGVCGRRREKAPHASLYNLLCDLEWDKPPGETKACGGDVMFRAAAFSKSGGFNEHMIAGEEGELCFRLREAGWKLMRIEHEMTRHDAAITQFSQWVKRAVRGGHAFAEGAFLHGRSPERYNVRSTRSAFVQGIAVPVLCFLLIFLSITVSPVIAAALLVPFCGYLIIGFRVYRHSRQRGWTHGISLMNAWYCLLAKPAEGLGVLKFWLNQLAGRRSGLIEYK